VNVNTNPVPARTLLWPRYCASILCVVGFTVSVCGDDAGNIDITPADHPLAWTYRHASARSDYIREHIRDYSCRLIKRERIDGKLQDYQFINVQMRCEQRDGDEIVKPMAVFMQYLAPKIVRDRRVLYIAGENDGLVLVRKGGWSMKYLKLEVDPRGRSARRESNYPITDIGFDKIIERLIERVTEDIERDPTAENTEVSHFRNAKVGKRVCTHIQVVHPEQTPAATYHKASLYIDDQLQVPIRLVVYDFPGDDGPEPPLMEEYIYANLQLNVGLTDADFSKAKLE